MSDLTVYFDEDCNFCISVKNIIQKLDTGNKISFQSLKETEDNLMAVDRDGNCYFSEEVMVEIAKILPGIRRFSWMFKGRAGEKASQLFYQGIEKIKKAHNRIYKRSPCVKC